MLAALATLLLGAVSLTAAADSYRLPLQAVPQDYNVSLVPYLDNAGNRSFTFDGEVAINVVAKEAVANLTLHAKDMDILAVSVSGVEVEAFSIETKRDFLTIDLNSTLTPGATYEVNIQFVGNLRNNLAGFYRSSYKTSGGATRWLATTQFEPTDARRAFPCFDEPALKATFAIRIAPPKGLHAVSNMPLAAITGPDPNTDDRYWYNFERSVPMSTYLVAFVVSDFAIVENGPFRILGKPEAIDTSRYPLSVSPAILEVMANLTGVEFTLPKMDQVAVPDFSAGAMENWGLVTYRQAYLLLDVDSTSRRRSAATVIAHEFAHQWFGNLVSPDWWTFTWLNEAFASFFEYFDTDKVEPDWDLLTSMVTSMQHSILKTDAKKTTHPITRYVESPSQISTSFDSITYSKGGALIKMVYHFLTEPTFYKGLNIYLKNKQFGAAVADDLFAAWQRAAAEDGVLPEGLTVKDVMDTWTLQAGFPVVDVERDYSAGTATLTQRRFMTSGEADNESWWVPISYTTRSEKEFGRTAPRAWLPPNASLVLRGLAPEDWLVLNIQDAAFYRVNYDEKNWELLLRALDQADSDGIHPLNRAQIMDDAAQLGVAHALRPDVAVAALRALRRESHPAVLRPVLRLVEQLYDRLANSEHWPALQGALAGLLEGVSSRTSRSDSAAGVLEELRDWLFAFSSEFDAGSLRNFPEYGRELSPAVLCAAVRISPFGWDAAWSRYTSAATATERRDALAALGCASDAQRLLDAALSDGAFPDAERVRAGDRAAAVAAPCGSSTRAAVGGGGADACLQALHAFAGSVLRRDVFDDIDDIVSIMHRFAARIRTEDQLRMLQLAASRVEREGLLSEGSNVLDDLLEKALAQVQWAKGEGKPVVSWLLKHQSGGRSELPEGNL